MKSGELDRRITIQTYSVSQSTSGEETKTFSTLATVWAKVEMTKGSEGFEADQLTAQAMTKFTIRYRTDVTEIMKILYGTVYYDIISIAEGVGRHVETIIIGQRKD